MSYCPKRFLIASQCCHRTATQMKTNTLIMYIGNVSPIFEISITKLNQVERDLILDIITCMSVTVKVFWSYDRIYWTL
jgi:hypothetical protein